MTRKQAQQLTDEIALEYLGRDWKERLTTIQAELWRDSFLPLKYNVAKKAVEKLFCEYPACENPFNYRMPFFNTTIQVYYKEMNSPKREYHPCCEGSGWITLIKTNSCVRCDCASSEVDMGNCTFTIKRYSELYKEYPEAKCDSFKCKPTKKHPCPMGKPFYNAKMIEFMGRMKKDPAFQEGLKLLKKGGLVENIILSMNDMSKGEGYE